MDDVGFSVVVVVVDVEVHVSDASTPSPVATVPVAAVPGFPPVQKYCKPRIVGLVARAVF